VQAQAERYDDLLRLIQQSWLGATTDYDLLQLAALATPLIATHPDLGRPLAAAFTWPDARLHTTNELRREAWFNPQVRDVTVRSNALRRTSLLGRLKALLHAISKL
jgi:hypothetical protein